MSYTDSTSLIMPFSRSGGAYCVSLAVSRSKQQVDCVDKRQASESTSPTCTVLGAVKWHVFNDLSALSSHTLQLVHFAKLTLLKLLKNTTLYLHSDTGIRQVTVSTRFT